MLIINIPIACIVSFLICTILCKFLIPVFRRIKLGQPILGYVKEHKDKNGTPTMGGLFFMLSSVIVFFLMGAYKGKIALVSLVVGLAFAGVGFLDDFIKIKQKENQGLKAYQKIIFQVVIGLFVGLFVYFNGLTNFYIPFTKQVVNLKEFSIPFVAIIMIATTNCVNLTDGLDGLAGSVSTVYFIFLAVLVYFEYTLSTQVNLSTDEYMSVQILIFAIIGGLIGFLLFNVNKASIFMGDTGSLGIGGFIGTLSIFTFNGFFIAILGIMFVFSGISVIIQVLHYKRTKRRILLMAPLHHHFQLKGLSESKISYLYSVVTAIMGLLCVLVYL